MIRPEYDADPQDWKDYIVDRIINQEAVTIDLSEVSKEVRHMIYSDFSIVNPLLGSEVVDTTE